MSLLRLSLALPLLLALCACGQPPPESEVPASVPAALPRVGRSLPSLPQTVAAQPAVLAQPELTVLSSALWVAYRENVAAAESKYQGRWVKIVGDVQHVKRSPKGRLYVGLLTVGDADREWFPGVLCYVAPGQEQAAAQLKIMKASNWIGRVKGMRRYAPAFGGFVIDVEDCRLAAD